MSGRREIELKRLLSGQGAADRLIAAIGPVEELKVQTNHLFDTVDRRLNKAGYAVRLRFENSSAFLTVKGPSHLVGPSTGSKIEAEASVEPHVADEILQNRLDLVAALRSRLPDSAYMELWRGLDDARRYRSLQRLGSFENQRRTIPVVLPSGITVRVEVDRTRFPDGRIDEEVEIELPAEDSVHEVETWLATTAHKAGVETQPSTPKIVRFLSALSQGSP
jgi:uncharacterized protein YjbK